MPIPKPSPVWEAIPGLRKWLRHEIGSAQALIDPARLYSRIMETFASELSDPKHALTLEELVSEAKRIYWSAKIELEFKKWIAHNSDLDEAVAGWEKVNKHIPREWIEERARLLMGVTKMNVKAADFMRGLGRIGSKEDLAGEEIKIAPTSAKSPCDAKFVGTLRKSWKVMIVNGVNLGLPHTRLIQDNPVRQKFAEAAMLGANAIVLTNIFDVEFGKSAGPLATYRSRVQGSNVKVGVLALHYQDEAKRILRDKPEDELLYITPEEVFIDLLSGLHKVAVRPDNTPEFPGKVFVVLGYREEQIIAAGAHWHMRYLTIVKWHKLGIQIRMAETELRRLEKSDDAPASEIENAERRVAELREQQSRTIISNITAVHKRRLVNKFRSFVIRKIEDALPNAKVVGVGSTMMKFGEDLVEISIPSHVAVTTSLLERFVSRHSPKLLRGELAKLTVVCHPYAVSYRSTVREADRSGVRSSAQVCVAPIVVNDRFLRESIGGTVRTVHPIEAAIGNDQFKPGALMLSAHHGAIDIDEIPISPRSPAALAPLVRTSKTPPSFASWQDERYIWLMTATDPHWGGKAKVFLWCNELKRFLGVAEAAIHLMRRAGLFSERRLAKFPIAFFNMNDDGVQGHNFPTQQEHHPNRMTYAELERFGADMLRHAANIRGVEKRLDIMSQTIMTYLRQFHIRGEDWTGAQMEELFDSHICPNMDFFHAVLSHAVDSNLILRGGSHFRGELVDRRDPGFINQGSGNHVDHSVEGEFTEGDLYASWMRLKLTSEYARWRSREADLKRLIRAPRYSKTTIAFGTVQAPGGYEYGLEFRGSPARMSSWNDPLAGAVANDLMRGNYSRIFDGRLTLKTYGDKHFFSSVSTPYALYEMTASGTETDAYGERGFAPNNTGVSFIGLPVDGPEYPILRRTLRYDQLFRLLNEPKGRKGIRIDWEEFLPNPVLPVASS
ncbi:MAG TPA: hypothetical protein VLB83_02025 [Candidatus Paceibacterota bacterium]|nr:hypothetical protein [Candidatus Paceibacterota bacterium]